MATKFELPCRKSSRSTATPSLVEGMTSQRRDKFEDKNMKLLTKYLRTTSVKILLVVFTVSLITGCDSLNRLYDHNHNQKNTANDSAVMHSQPVRPYTFVVYGQSNAVSYIRGYDGRVLQYSTSGRVEVTDPRTAKWEELVTPTKQSPWDVSIAWLYCGESLVQTGNRSVRFINTAAGGKTSRDLMMDPNCYIHFLKAVDDYKPDLVLWHQGESDDQMNFSEDETYSNMKKIIEASHDRCPSVRWIVALNSAGTDPNKAVRRAQQRIINEGLAFQGPDTDLLRSNTSIMSADGLHFVGDGFRQFGEMWANSIRMVM